MRNDTIYRQDAIDAINHICPVDTEYDCTLLDRVDVRCVLSELPSAQPEPSTEIQEILNYLDTTLHPIVSPDNWNVYAELHDMVSRLPSAQPEPIKINIEDFNKEDWERFKKEWGNMPITVLPARPEQRWIPVTERLPEEYTRVIGYMAWKAITTIEYQHGRWYSIDHLEPLPDEAVIAWMPLPEPYEERGTDETD